MLFIMLPVIFCFSQEPPGLRQDFCKCRHRESWRPDQDLLQTFRIAGRDLKEVSLSPLRMNRRHAYWLGGMIALTSVVYAYDDEIADYIHARRHKPGWEEVLDVGYYVEPIGYMGFTNKFYAAGMGVGYLMKWDKLTRMSAEIFEANLLAGLFKNIANIAGRARPYQGRGSRAFRFNKWTSFPSGHTVVIFNLATVLSHHVDRWPFTIAAYGIAASVGLQRFESRSHWPSDVAAGAILGTTVTRAMLKLHEQDRVTALPFYSARQAAWGLQWQIRF